MEVKSTEAKKFVLNYGVLLGILSVILGVVMYVTNAYLEPTIIYSIIGILIIAVVISMGIAAFKKENENYLSVSEALKVGIGIAVIGGIIAAIWSYLLMNFIEPEYMNQMMDMQREKMLEASPDMSQAQVDSAMEMAAKFSSPWMIMAFSLIGNLFFGLIISLIAGLVMKNKDPRKI